MGHANAVDVAKLQKEFAPFLVEGESLVAGYQLVRDLLVFTNKRLILVDKQGVTSKKTEYMTIPYTSIVRFSKESAGMFDLDADFKLWVRGQEDPIVKQFKQDQHVNDVYRLLSEALLG
jgi:hypothetical protein